MAVRATSAYQIPLNIGLGPEVTQCAPSSNEMLAAAREAVDANPALIGAAATSLEANGHAVPHDVLHAVETLRFKQWVFLRDTTTHSVFIEPDGNEAYAVLGLTDRIRNILGGSAVAIKAGVVEYRGRYVCDGIVGNPIWLGSNLKKEFNAALSHLKKKGRFHVACEPHRLARAFSRPQNWRHPSAPLGCDESSDSGVRVRRRTSWTCTVAGSQGFIGMSVTGATYETI